jgi:site-specific DNA recombinase
MLRNTFDPRRPHRYIRYGRMSTDQQNERSPDQQFDSIDRLVQRSGHPWVHIADYRDDGISGRYKRKRPGYQKMLQDVRSGELEVDLILVDTAERFGRVEDLTSIRQDLFTKHGVLVLTADSQFADPTTVQGMALTFVESMRATEDGRIKAHNVLRGKRDAARQKHWPGGPPPFGYKLQSVLVERHGRQEVDHCILVPDGAKSWIIERLFGLAHRTGWGTTRLAKAFNVDPEIPAEFKPFYSDTIGYWLRNPIYMGELLWEEHCTGIANDTRVVKRNAEEDMLRITGFCEPLVSREIWEAVAELRKVRSENHSRLRHKPP